MSLYDARDEQSLSTEPPPVDIPDSVGVRWGGLRFADPALEAHYIEQRRVMPPSMPAQALVGVLGWLSLLVWDLGVGKAVEAQQFAPLRVLAAAASGLITLGFYRSAWVKQRWELFTQLYFVPPCVACIVSVWLSTGQDMVYPVLAAFGFALLTMFAATASHLSPERASTLVAPLWLLFSACFLYRYGDVRWGTTVGVILFSMTGVAVGVFAGYGVELQRRRSFVAELRTAWAKHRSDALLTNVLPVQVASRLRAGEERVAERFEAVSVLFADIVGFTPLSASMDPDALLALLDRIFLTFDEAAERHGVEKIKTIGDAYMAVAGAPTPSPDHALQMARFALEMPRLLAAVEAPEGVTLQVRVGIHSGPVSGGVIGAKRLAFDLWGDTVNTASRMESHGEPGRIQISADTAALLAESDIATEPRGPIAIKGKGTMETCFLAA